MFDPEFGKTGGEDVDFFKRMIRKGNVFVWCNEAPVFELVSPSRCKRSYFLKRAILRGLVNSKQMNLINKETFKSIIAISAYSFVLLIFFFTGHHIFMKYLIRDCDHLGKILGICNLPIIKKRTF